MLRCDTTAVSDMDGLPDQGEIQGERGAFPWTALHADMPRMLLDNAVGDRKSKTGAAILAFGRRRLGGEEGIVDFLNVLRRDAGARVRDADADKIAVQGGHAQHAAAIHCVLGVQEQIQEDLLQASGVALDKGQVFVQFRLDLDAGYLELMLEQRESVTDYLVQADLGELGSGRT